MKIVEFLRAVKRIYDRIPSNSSLSFSLFPDSLIDNKIHFQMWEISNQITEKIK